MEKEYVGPYKVFRIYRKSRRVQIIEKGLTLEQAQRLTQSYPDSNMSMVCFTKQYTSEKYYRNIN